MHKKTAAANRERRVLARAESTFGDAAKALTWLREPKRRFQGRTPMEMLTTADGEKRVTEMLVQIDEGMFA